MGIPNELSSDVAAAVLSRKDRQVPAETRELIEIVRNFHSTLRDLTNEERRRRIVSTPAAAEAASATGQAATGAH